VDLREHSSDLARVSITPVLGEISEQVGRTSRLTRVVTERARTTDECSPLKNPERCVMDHLTRDQRADLGPTTQVLWVIVDVTSGALEREAHGFEIGEDCAQTGELQIIGLGVDPLDEPVE
jgi:hypothetical protein